MRTLVFGGTGMLGRQVVAAARRRGFPALGLAHGEADVTDGERLLYWVREFRPELVVNAAAFTQVDACETERERAFAVNGLGAGAAAQAAAAVGAILVQVSTDYVFDGAGSSPYAEDAPTAPLSVYGASKLRGEELALAYGRALVVRTSWLFGPGGPNFVATMVRRLKGGEPLRVVDDQWGAPTYTPYLAQALLDLAAQPVSGVFHYRNREPVTWYGFAREIANLWAGAPAAAAVTAIATADYPRPAPRPAYSVLDVRRFEAAVGRRVEPWEAGLSRYLPSLV